MSSGYGENSPHGANSKAYNEGVYWKKREERLKAEKAKSIVPCFRDGAAETCDCPDHGRSLVGMESE